LDFLFPPHLKAWLDVLLVVGLFGLVILMASDMWEKSIRYYSVARIVEEARQCIATNGTPHVFCGPQGYGPYGLSSYACPINFSGWNET